MDEGGEREEEEEEEEEKAVVPMAGMECLVGGYAGPMTCPSASVAEVKVASRTKERDGGRIPRAAEDVKDKLVLEEEEEGRKERRQRRRRRRGRRRDMADGGAPSAA